MYLLQKQTLLGCKCCCRNLSLLLDSVSAIWIKCKKQLWPAGTCCICNLGLLPTAVGPETAAIVCYFRCMLTPLQKESLYTNVTAAAAAAAVYLRFASAA